ncbi:unnamed protein product [Trichogramma brassicae]|uniref:Cytochrome P450 n=1 Tax=Trichogramma brassicae TaxID=86971 RepID=A0A6H5ICJ3_9HYME|nr:unnamed protein product [Trichogramma brassicae]
MTEYSWTNPINTKSGSISTYSQLTSACASFLFSGFLALVVACLIKKLRSKKYKEFWTQRHLPILVSAPVIGHFWKCFFKLKSLPDHMVHLYKAFPGASYFGASDFSTPVIVVKDTKIVQLIMVKHFNDFSNHSAFVTEEMDPILGKNLFSLKGSRWRHFRNLLSPNFTALKMKQMFELVKRCSGEFVKYFAENPEARETIECKDALSRYTNDVITSTTLGIEVNSMIDRENEFLMRGHHGSVSSVSLWKFVKVVSYKLADDEFFKGVVTKVVQNREEKGSQRVDMIHMLMEARRKQEGLDDERMIKVGIDDIIAQAFIFYSAGFDTASNLMCFLAYELARNPDIQEKARAEVDEYIATNGDLTYDGIKDLKYLDMVVNETLRLYPPTPLTDRTCLNAITLPPHREGFEGTKVPQGTKVVIPIYAIQRDPENHPDPERFDPERFNDERKHGITDYNFLPFGAGPRKCIGNRFALMETKVLFFDILRRFALKLDAKTADPPVYSKKNFNTVMKDGCWIKLIKRT